ncbi:tyrosine-type recombinase/integrase [Mycobacterium sp.]|uniref:tyrosine-type recombinase/integrase n=1 Tax=Mycobacterium sp. TaxID=1785 RepID=UPI003F95E936
MTAVLAGEPEPRRHAHREEYFTWLDTVFNGGIRACGEERIPVIESRRYFYSRFVRHWPDLEEWFAAPLLTRLDLGSDGAPAVSAGGNRNGPSCGAGSYLVYLSMVHRISLDADYVLSRNFDSLLNPRIAPALGVDLELFDSLDQRQRLLGYRYGRAWLTWAITRLLLWKGDPDISTIDYDDLTAFGAEIRRWCALPEAPRIRAGHVHRTRRIHDPAVLAPLFEKECHGRLYGLHVLLFNTGQICHEPMRGLRTDAIWKQQPVPPGTPPGIAAPIDRWLSGRLQTTDRAESVRGARDAFRYLLRWLAADHPEITSLTELTRDHTEAYLTHLHDRINPRNGKPLAARTRYTYISPLLNFFRETSQWGWDDVPARPLLSRSDLPKLPARLPRFIPRDELDRLMKAIEGLENPYQRTALLLVRWSGARRGEIRRLTLDCLDTYQDGYPRLRIPVGKTYTERMIPLHPQAADPLRDLIELAKTSGAAARYDTWAQQSVRWVFTHRGQPMGKNYLFDEPLDVACHAAGLLDAEGKPTVSAHRFRHTVGTQLAEGGAQIQTLMAILRHRNAQMAVTYSHISDPVLKEQYEKIIAAGGRVAGPAAEALLSNQLDQDTVNWLKTNFFKTELELGHCLRTPAEGPCECDLYLRCSKFFTTSEYVPRLRARLVREQELVQDAVERGWPREAERHTAISARIRDLLTELGESVRSDQPDT